MWKAALRKFEPFSRGCEIGRHLQHRLQPNNKHGETYRKFQRAKN